MGLILVHFTHHIGIDTCDACHTTQAEYVDLSSRNSLGCSIQAILQRYIFVHHNITINKEYSSFEFIVHIEWDGLERLRFGASDLLMYETDPSYFSRQIEMLKKRGLRDTLRVQFNFQMHPSVKQILNNSIGGTRWTVS